MKIPFRIHRSYKSSLTVEQIYQFLDHLSSKKSEIWTFKSNTYDVQVDDECFSIKKRGGSINGQIHPLVKGEIMNADFVQVSLDIKPSYSTMFLSFIVGSILLFSLLLSEKITINGVYRSITLLERTGFVFFVVAIPAGLSYFKTIKPTQDTEKWLIREMQLKPLPNE
ncbi:hypothetical protein [Hymenobacter terrestris]|uniref:DUF389 domain-containing protein n=1 Tax=Hymenobacter terrestris TaxID=2748310 RepID=A0ABX2Q4U9_9BACT|nr:hypothetical protein [Hymenobacter terrestris]NVO85320.1 hypothetical protein [Hymenobacter terrestris]